MIMEEAIAVAKLQEAPSSLVEKIGEVFENVEVYSRR
jgi:hypothetical protein